MYLDYYHLQFKPFQISTDPKFLWLGEKHQEALAVLKYGILDNKGFLLLTGDVGTGKTTLLNTLVNSLGDDVLVAMVPDPGLAKLDFFNFIADSFQMEKRFRSKGDFLIHLRSYLLALYEQGKQVLLIIDECQQLNQKMLEEVRLLSNIEKQDRKLINIFFVGQVEFNEIILRPRNRAIRQRITINYNISPLLESETKAYIDFRLKVASVAENMFTPSAVKEIHAFSNGYPRLINIICDQALLTGFVKEKKKIGQKIIVECAQELRIEDSMAMPDSRATPEFGSDANRQPSMAGALARAVDLRMDNPLAKGLFIALIVAVIVWGTLLVAFWVNRYPAGPLDQGGPDLSPSRSHAAVKDHPKKEARSPATRAEQANESAPMVEQSGQQPDHLHKEAANGKNGRAISFKQLEALYGPYPQIHFAFDSNTLGSDSYEKLDRIARFCTDTPGVGLILRGYTDTTGLKSYNYRLAEFRANMVKTYLVGKGVPAASISTLAIGPGREGPAGTIVPLDEPRRMVIVEIRRPK